jgi:proteasome accessory factor A
MTKDADFKKLVRQQMAITGRSYTAARAAIYRPASGTELPLARRAFGLKTFYRVEFVRDGGQAGAEAGECLFHQVAVWGRSANVFLANGARFHLRPDEANVAQPAYATPECDSIVELVAAERTADKIIARLAGDAEERLVHEGSYASLRVDRVEGGQSESYLVPASVEGSTYLRLLEPFLATRWVYGAVVARSQPQATLSAPAFADETKHRRVKVTGADPNRSQLATFLRVAATEQVLRLAESGGDVRLDHRRYTPTIDAVPTQRAYLAAAGRTPNRRPQDDVVLDAWRAALDNQEGAHDPSAGTSDWYLREQAGTSIMNLWPVSSEPATPPETASIATTAQVDRATNLPPQTTRARLRGLFIETAKDRQRDFTVDWVHLKLNDQTNRTLRCWDPLDANFERAEKLIASMANTVT